MRDTTTAVVGNRRTVVAKPVKSSVSGLDEECHLYNPQACGIRAGERVLDPPKLLQVENLTSPGEYLRQAGDLPANADGVLQSPAFAHVPSLACPRSAIKSFAEHLHRNAWLDRMLHWSALIVSRCL